MGMLTSNMPIDVKGYITGFHYCAKTKLWTKVAGKDNTVSTELKAIIRDNLNSPTDFAMDNMFTIDGEEWGGTGHVGGNPAGKDGILIVDVTNDKRLTLVTVVHPTDASGSYYRQWQGVLTNDFGVGSFVVNVLLLGVNMDAIGSYVYIYAAGLLTPNVTLAANDILTINWKLTVG